MKIQIETGGRTTDQILRYIFALHIKAQHPGAQIVNFSNDEWQIKTETSDFDLDRATALTKSNHWDYAEILSDDPEFVSIQWPPQDHRFGASARATLLAHLDALNITHSGERVISDDEILVHMRLGDIIKYSHNDYWPLPICWYAQIAKRENKRLVLMGEIHKHPAYFKAIQAKIPGTRMLPPGSVNEDFVRIQTAKHLIISLSSFSWLAAWLSQKANTIHVPYCGLFSTLRRPDIDLFDPEDPRYHFHVMPNLNRLFVYRMLPYNLRVKCRHKQISPNTSLWQFEDPRLLNYMFRQLARAAKFVRKSLSFRIG